MNSSQVWTADHAPFHGRVSEQCLLREFKMLLFVLLSAAVFGATAQSPILICEYFTCTLRVSIS